MIQLRGFSKGSSTALVCWAKKQWRANALNLNQIPKWMLQVLPDSPLWVRACRCLEIGLDVLREFADRLEIVSVWDRRAPLAVTESLCGIGREVLAAPTCGRVECASPVEILRRLASDPGRFR